MFIDATPIVNLCMKRKSVDGHANYNTSDTDGSTYQAQRLSSRQRSFQKYRKKHKSARMAVHRTVGSSDLSRIPEEMDAGEVNRSKTPSDATIIWRNKCFPSSSTNLSQDISPGSESTKRITKENIAKALPKKVLREIPTKITSSMLNGAQSAGHHSNEKQQNSDAAAESEYSNNYIFQCFTQVISTDNNSITLVPKEGEDIMKYFEIQEISTVEELEALNKQAEKKVSSQQSDKTTSVKSESQRNHKTRDSSRTQKLETNSKCTGTRKKEESVRKYEHDREMKSKQSQKKHEYPPTKIQQSKECDKASSRSDPGDEWNAPPPFILRLNNRDKQKKKCNSPYSNYKDEIREFVEQKRSAEATASGNTPIQQRTEERVAAAPAAAPQNKHFRESCAASNNSKQQRSTELGQPSGRQQRKRDKSGSPVSFVKYHGVGDAPIRAPRHSPVQRSDSEGSKKLPGQKKSHHCSKRKPEPSEKAYYNYMRDTINAIRKSSTDTISDTPSIKSFKKHEAELHYPSDSLISAPYVNNSSEESSNHSAEDYNSDYTENEYEMSIGGSSVSKLSLINAVTQKIPTADELNIPRHPIFCPIGNCGSPFFITNYCSHIERDHLDVQIRYMKPEETVTVYFEPMEDHPHLSKCLLLCLVRNKLTNLGTSKFKDYLPVMVMSKRIDWISSDNGQTSSAVDPLLLWVVGLTLSYPIFFRLSVGAKTPSAAQKRTILTGQVSSFREAYPPLNESSSPSLLILAKDENLYTQGGKHRIELQLTIQ